MKINDSTGRTWDVKARVWNGTSWVRIGEYVWYNEIWNLIKYWLGQTSVNYHSATNIDDVVSSVATITRVQDPT